MSIKGIVSVCQGFVTSYSGLVVARFFLGLFEAGFESGTRTPLASASFLY